MSNKAFTMFMWGRDDQGRIVLNIDGKYLKHEEAITLRDELNILLPKDGPIEQPKTMESPEEKKEQNTFATVLEKLDALAKMVQEQQIKRLKDMGMDCDVNIDHCKTKVITGRKYTKIDVGHSGKLMIDNVTQQIFGIKAYGQIHKGHYYGTLDTINEWNWGDFYPRKISR